MDKLPIAFHPAARSEALDAFDFYFERSPSAARAFHSALDSACLAIQQSPETWAAYLFGTRRYLLSHFPYVLVYRVADDGIQVVAVAHGHRQPGYWAERL